MTESLWRFRRAAHEFALSAADTATPGDVGVLAQEYLRLRSALEHLASPNRAARPTGHDAIEMAQYARDAIAEDE